MSVNNRWTISRIGLINFWYYDDEEFVFEQGKLLLRGANGSGKSVTMQSFIPLLLDGNKNPSRLDPFGSKARKLDHYLIEEDSGLDERTGYLYMEFNRQETDEYLSMGMGLRARAGKPLDSWYFTVTDNRRIGKDIFLYKQERDGDKICRTKNELRGALGDGGLLVEKQSEYMEMVNQLLFGFSGLDEYKEMITLLVQLRTPKLSKDFTPTLIAQILDGSLQTLTEEDLRPMSEAIENMDAIKANLDHMEECRKTADKIMQVYDQYNQLVLLEKSKKYIDLHQIAEKAQTDALNLEKEGQMLVEALETAIMTEGRLKEEQVKLEAKKQDLEKNDAVAIKENLNAYEEEQDRQKKHIVSKTRELESKLGRQTSIENEIKGKKAEEDGIRQEIMTGLEEMRGFSEEMHFTEHGLMSAELKKVFGDPFAFDFTRKAAAKHESDLKEGTGLLLQQKAKQEELNKILETYDVLTQKKEESEAASLDAEQKVEEAKATLMEDLQSWAFACIELHLPQDVVDKLLRQVADFTTSDHYFDGRRTVSDDYSRCRAALEKEKVAAEVRYNELIAEKEEKEAKIKELETAEEIAPERDEATQKNRAHLTKLGIPHIPFYRLIDFRQNVSEEQASRVEEALLRMGVLDALVVPEAYKNQVLTVGNAGDADNVNNAGNGCADRYLFAKHRLENSLANVLMIDAVAADTGSGADTGASTDTSASTGTGARTSTGADETLIKQLSHTLHLLGFESREGSTRISRNGSYGIGVLRGGVSGQYQAKYIGEQARHRNRQRMIEAVRQELSASLQSMEVCASAVQALEVRLAKLTEEYESVPKDTELVQSMRTLRACDEVLTRIKTEWVAAGEEKERESEALAKITAEATRIAAKLEMQVRLDLFESANEAATSYREALSLLTLQYQQFRSTKEMREARQSQYEEMEEDIDTIRYDLGVAERMEREIAGKIENCLQQLALSDYEEIREELDFCLSRLKEIGPELEILFGTIGQTREQIEQNRQRAEEARENTQIQKTRCALMGEALEVELALGYVESTDAVRKDLLSRARQWQQTLEGEKSVSKDRDDIQNSVQQQFFGSIQQLAEYNMMLDGIFEEKEELPDIRLKRIDITCKLRGRRAKLHELTTELKDLIENQKNLLRDSDREIFEDILTNTISRKISDRIFRSEMWVKKINELMQSMSTSSGLTLSLSWRSKKAESEEQLGANELVNLLKKDPGLMRDEDIDKLAGHFRSKIDEARRRLDEKDTVQTFHTIMREVLDYRKWFEFELYYKKTGKGRKVLTNREFFTFSGGEKAMAMYVPLFSAVMAKYQGARDDAPRLISLDEAFAGVDDMNIKDMFRLMEEFEFSYIINSQVLWGDYETVPGLAIYHLYRPDNASFVTSIRYLWNGTVRKVIVEDEQAQMGMLIG